MKKNCELFGLGAIVGMGVGLLFAPKSGREMRKDLGKVFDSLEDECCDMKEDFDTFMRDLEEDISNFRGESVLEEAEEKASLILQKADDLVDFALEEGDAAFQKTAKAMRKKAIDVTKKVLNKLENMN